MSAIQHEPACPVHRAPVAPSAARERRHEVYGRLRRDPLGLFAELQAEQGDLAFARIGGRDLVLLGHPEQIKHVLVSHARDYVRATTTIKTRDEQRWIPSRGGLISSTDHDTHLRARRLLQPAFRQARMDAHAGHFTAVVEDAIGRWGDSEQIDALQEMRRLALDMSAEVTFGRRLPIPTEDLIVRLRRFLSIASPVTSGLRESLSRLRLVRMVRIAVAYDGLLAHVEELFDEVRRTGEGESAVAVLVAQGGDEGLDTRALALEAIGLLFADFDSTATAAAWSLYLLARHPGALEAVRAEAARDDGDRQFVEAVVSEALRLYPPSWGISRAARQDHDLAGVPVRAGTSIWISPYLLHRDARWFSDPDRFAPERWRDGSARTEHTYIPFSVGPHKCPGYALALGELCAIVSTVARRCDLTSLAPEPVGVVAGSSVHPGTRLRLRVTKVR